MNSQDDRPVTAPDEGATSSPPPTSQVDGAPTFTSAAESLLKHLRLGGPRAAALPAAGPAGFPHVPNYTIESELGRGGMGVVYLARHTVLRHAVAVKMILMAEHVSAGEVARFVGEAEAVAAVRHPNVVQVYDLGEVSGRPYFVMEYVEGGTLARRIRTGGPLAPLGAAALIGAVARGVQAAHDAGIVHRDLKPGNILLQVESQNVESRNVAEPGRGPYDLSTLRLADVTPKVSDFGLAKRMLSDATLSQAVLGTPAYMAPEQAGGRAKFVGPQADVYALGVVLYECLTARLPFDADEPWALIQQVLEGPPEPPRRRAPGVPRDLELICLKCLEKEPHHRYPTAAALADDLARVCRGEPVSVRPIGAPTRALRWAKKRPAQAALAAAGALLVLVVPALTVWVQGQLNQRAAVAAEARQKEDAARRAEAEADKARIAAERLAEARELFALENAFRTRAAARPLGWTAATRAEVPRAVALAGGDPATVEALRSAAAGALLAHDLFPAEPVAKGMTGSALATDPKSDRVAVGEFKAWGWNDGRVLLIDPARAAAPDRLTFPTALVFKSSPLDPVQDGARSLAYSPDGTRLYIGTRSSKVMRFELNGARTKPTASWKVATGAVERLAVGPDGKTVYGLCAYETAVRAWDADTGRELPAREPKERAPIRSFAVLPSGDVVAGNGHQLYQWNEAGALVRSVPNATCDRLAPAGGSVLLVSDGPRLEVYDSGTLEPVARFVDPSLRQVAHDGAIRSIAVHPSGAFAATAADHGDRTVKVWELASGRLVGTVASAGTEPIMIAWSGDGSHLLATAEDHLDRWRFAPAGAQQFACFSGPPLEAAAFVHGGPVAALGAVRNGRRELLVGPAAGGPARTAFLADGGGDGQPALAADPVGGLAITVESPGIRLWKPGTAVPAALTTGASRGPQFDPDGAGLWAVVDSKTVRRYDPVTKAETARWSNRIADHLTGLSSLNALAVGRRVAVAGGRDGAVYVLDPQTCHPTGSAPPNAGDPVLAVAVTPDDALALAGTQSGKLRVVRTADRTELSAAVAHAGGVTAVAIDRTGALLVTGGRDRTVRFWKRTGDRFEVLFAVSDLPGAVAALGFDPAGDRLMVLLASEHAVRVWDVDRLRAELADLGLGWSR